jgi:hypothetical protein
MAVLDMVKPFLWEINSVFGTAVFCCLAILFAVLMFDTLFTTKQRTAFSSGFDL